MLLLYKQHSVQDFCTAFSLPHELQKKTAPVKHIFNTFRINVKGYVQSTARLRKLIYIIKSKIYPQACEQK